MPVQKYDIKQPNGNFEERYWSPSNTAILDEKCIVTHVLHVVEDVTSLLKSRETENLQKEENISLHRQNKTMSIEIYDRMRQLDQAYIELKATNARLAEKAELLELSNEDLAQFAETASHDIKAPFRTIGGHLSIIEGKVEHLNDQEINQSLESIKNGRKRIASLLDDLLSFARVTRATEEKEKIDIKKILNEVAENLEFLVKEKNGQIKFPDEIPAIKGINTQIFQLFQNLIGNGLKFSEEQPVVEISFIDKGLHVEFAITDNGIGIEAEYFQKIFSPFQRLHTNTEYQGTGLGLTICKKIVERHGGCIWIESKKEKGSVFYFTLPKY
jgi:signal transduction histidine kinase